ncbi:MAG: 50S ribosomal protein L23 [Bacilli bacterium]
MAEETKKTEQVASEAESKKAPAKKAAKKTAAKAEPTKAEKLAEKGVKATGEFKYRAAIIKDFSIIKHMIATEETRRLQAEENALVFAVDTKATKSEIKRAVQAIFSAKVKSVNTVHVIPKKKRVGRYVGTLAAYKKAIVRFDSSFDLGKITDAIASEETKATKADKAEDSEKK